MSIQQQVILRHRSEGHLRFDLPAVLRASETADHLASGLRTVDGVYRVEITSGKLSIRYQEVVAGFAVVVRRLNALIEELLGKSVKKPSPAKRPNPARAIQTSPAAAESGIAVWVRSKVEEIKETLTAAGIVAKSGLGILSQRPRWLGEFLNDLLMLFLIKLHWHQILTLWLPSPWRYRYEWAATFYLIYLQVQSRLPQPRA